MTRKGWAAAAVAVLVVAACGVVVAACGDDDDDTGEAETAEESAPSTEAAEATAEATTPATEKPTTAAGRIRWSGVAPPPLGSQPSLTAKSRISRIDSRKLGIAWTSTAPVITAPSTSVPRLVAAKMPIALPRSSAMARPTPISSSVAGAFSSTTLSAGLPSISERPNPAGVDHGRSALPQIRFGPRQQLVGHEAVCRVAMQHQHIRRAHRGRNAAAIVVRPEPGVGESQHAAVAFGDDESLAIEIRL